MRGDDRKESQTAERSETLARYQTIKIDFRPQNRETQGDANYRQAREILEKARELHNLGVRRIGVTYSANVGQIADFKKAYGENWDQPGQPTISGDNQAQVMMAALALLKREYADLKYAFRIVGVATMGFKSQKNNEIAAEHKEILDAAKEFVEKHEDHVLLGWQNQNAQDAIQPAIGGPIEARSLPEETVKKNRETRSEAFTKLSANYSQLPAKTDMAYVLLDTYRGFGGSDSAVKDIFYQQTASKGPFGLFKKYSTEMKSYKEIIERLAARIDEHHFDRAKETSASARTLITVFGSVDNAKAKISEERAPAPTQK